MNLYRGIQILSILILLLVSGASAVTIVVYDGNAALSIAATPDGAAALSFVAAEEPDTFSATVSASDTGGMRAGQESSISGASSAVTLGAAFSPDGDSAVTSTRVYTGNLDTTQQAVSGTGGISVEHVSSVTGHSGDAGSVATDSRGNKALELFDFIFGTSSVGLAADTGNSANASMGGSFLGLAASTEGFARSRNGDYAFTDAKIGHGGMTFANSATAFSEFTSAFQDVTMAGALGSTTAGSTDMQGNFALQTANFIAGILSVEQTADTSRSATANQTGGFAGLGLMTNGFARSTDGDISLTHSGVFTGGMTFDNAAKAQDINTTASQKVMIAGLFGQAGADAFDKDGNITTQDVVFGAGLLNADQNANTFNSAHATQTGTFAGAGAMTAGFAIAQDGDASMTDAEILLGEMTFTNEAVAQDTTSSAYQDFTMAGVLGHAGARSIDQDGNYAREYAFMAGGSITDNLSADTFTSANAYQYGTLSAALGFTGGEARYGDERSWTNADLVVGTMNFGNHATANGDTYAGQEVLFSGIDGIPVAGAGSTSAGSDDGSGNTSEVGAGFVLGTMEVSDQYANTAESAYARQIGSMGGAYGTTWADAAFESEHSWSNADVFVGTMTFDNIASADGSTYADNWEMQFGGIDGIPVAGTGSVSTGSDDGRGNSTGAGAVFILGTMYVPYQYANTSESAHAHQDGTMSAAYGTTWANAIFENENSWTDAEVILGTSGFSNDALANGRTYASQAVQFSGLDGVPVTGAGRARSGSSDGTNTTMIGTEFLLGTLGISQYSRTSGPVAPLYSNQTGEIPFAAYGHAWGESFDTGSGAWSWTDSDFLVGTMNIAGDAGAGASTFSSQMLDVTALAARTSAGSDDNAGNTANVLTEFLIGTLNLEQGAHTGSSAGAGQKGTLIAGFGNTRGEAGSDYERSWTESGMIVGMNTYENKVGAGASTFANQTANMVGLSGWAVSGSDDGAGNATEVGAEVSGGDLLGLLGVDWNTVDFDNLPGLLTQIVGNVGGGLIWMNQSADTGGSAHADQSGTVLAIGDGRTWSEATFGANEQSWTSANVTTGVIWLNSNEANAGGSTDAGQNFIIAGLSGQASANSTDSMNSAGIGAKIDGGSLDPSGIINAIISGDLSGLASSGFGNGAIAMNQQGNTSGSAHANQSGSVMAFANGRTWGNALSGDNHSWTSANVTSGMLTLGENTVTAGGSTSGVQDVRILGDSGDAWAGSMDGTNYTEVGAGFSSGSLSESWLLVPLGFYSQETHTGSSAYSTQSGLISATSGTGNTWGNALSGDNHSWTNASVVSGSLTVGENTMTAGTTTSGVQDVRILGESGDAWVGSTDSTNYTEVGAGFTSGSLSESWLLVPLGFYSQETHTGSSAYSTQSGLISATSGTGNTWGNAISGDNHSWTNASVVSGSLTVGENTVTAGTTTSGVQDVRISALGGSGDAWVGSTDGTNYAETGTGFTSGSMAESYSGLGVPQGYFSQTTNTETSALANQTGRIRSFKTTLGGAWTWNEAGNESGRQVYVETKARSGTFLGAPAGVTLRVTNAGAYGSDAIAQAYENKAISGSGSGWSSSAFASGTTTDASTSSTVSWAWAT